MAGSWPRGIPLPAGGRVIDLTLPIHAGMPVYPGDPEITIEPVGDGTYAVHRVSLGTHAGTHIDAPAHLDPGGAGVDAIPLAACLGPARVVDCTGLRQITREALRERAPGLAAGDRLLLRTDWDLLFGKPGYYTEFPGLTLDAARWLAELPIALLGVETPSLSTEEDHGVHQELLAKGVVVVEGLANLARIPSETCWFAALPLLLPGLDSSPVRAVAWLHQ
ncbi:MAG TPA: cyclase family protein [Armatimonadota bacterium]|nr:cyclase family protein [Armatimonadota bacterium]